MPFSIHQFSRGLTPTQNQRGEWVSRGFGAEIANESFDVPEEIKQAVTLQEGGWRGLRIPDTHPPKPSEIALIARDLGNYCVLAVANRLKDDTVPREFVGYRYFWLDKTQFQNYPNRTSIDSIGTLLWYWQDKGQPQYNIEELQNNRISYTTSWDNLQQVYLFEHWQQQHYQRIQSLISDIRPSHQPLIYEAIEIGGQLTYQEVHCLAIQYCTVNRGYIINWAWNVRKLENLQGLNVIYCADAEALQLFNRQFPSRVIIPTPAPTPTPTSTSSLQGGMTASPTARASATKNQSEVTKCLENFLNKDFRSQDILLLIKIYQEYGNDIGDVAKPTEINKINESNPQPFAIQYATLITALAPNNNNGQIFKKLMHLNEQQKWVAIKFLVDLQQIAGQNDSCSQHPEFLKFSYALTALQNNLLKSLEPKGSNFSLSNILKKINQSKPHFSIFFFLLLAGSAGLIYWQKPNIWLLPNILPRLSWPGHSDTTNTGGTGGTGGGTVASSGVSGSLGDLLGKYDRQYQIFQLAEQNKPEIEKNNTLQELKTELENYRNKISDELKNDTILARLEKGQSDDSVKQARQQQIYQDLQQLLPVIDPKNLPVLKPETQEANSPAEKLKPAIIMLQKSLERRGHYDGMSGKQDYKPGSFDENTQLAVQNAQKAFNKNQKQDSQISEDGIVGTKTWGVVISRIQDIQVEAVYQTLKISLEEGTSTLNIVTEIKQCRDNKKDEKALDFNDCLLEKIGTSTTQSNEGAGSG